MRPATAAVVAEQRPMRTARCHLVWSTRSAAYRSEARPGRHALQLAGETGDNPHQRRRPEDVTEPVNTVESLLPRPHTEPDGEQRLTDVVRGAIGRRGQPGACDREEQRGVRELSEWEVARPALLAAPPEIGDGHLSMFAGGLQRLLHSTEGDAVPDRGRAQGARRELCSGRAIQGVRGPGRPTHHGTAAVLCTQGRRDADRGDRGLARRQAKRRNS